MVERPYTEKQITSKSYLRTFLIDTSEEELKWHWDEEDRIIFSVEETDWLFQFDNKLPQSMNSKIFIPKGQLHRIIKGSDDLLINVTLL